MKIVDKNIVLYKANTKTLQKYLKSTVDSAEKAINV